MNIDSSLEYSKVQDNEKETKNVFGDYQEEGKELESEKCETRVFLGIHLKKETT